MKRKKIIILIIILMIALIVWFIFIKPAIIGYSVYSELKGLNYSIENYGKNLSELQSEIKLMESNLSDYKEANQKLQSQLEKESSEKTKFINKLEECEKKLEDYETLKEQYEILIKNSADNICCKNKVDNPKINYYEIVDNKIKCLEKGEKKISCPFE